VMMAHVSYPAVDPDPAGYSRRWIELLRGELGFRGVVFSDDIGMAAAESAGGVAARIHAHYDAGCDSVLVCAPALVPDALVAMEGRTLPGDALHPLLGRESASFAALTAAPRWREVRATLGIDSTV
jgi:beta-N-acetylhexosaminidase